MLWRKCVSASIVVAVALTIVVALPWARAQIATQGASKTTRLAEPAGDSFDGTWWLSFGPPPQRPTCPHDDSRRFHPGGLDGRGRAHTEWRIVLISSGNLDAQRTA